jgi:hypothetical protein
MDNSDPFSVSKSMFVQIYIKEYWIVTSSVWYRWLVYRYYSNNEKWALSGRAYSESSGQWPHPTQPNPTHLNFEKPDPTQPNPTQPNPTQPNPWINPTHGQLWSYFEMREMMRKK